MTPGRCSGEEAVKSETGLRVVQLLSGRDHAVVRRADSPKQRRLFTEAQQMVNFQYLVGDAASRLLPSPSPST